MKKIALSLILLIFIGVESFSQVKPFRFGFKLAPNIAWISPNSEGYKSEGAAFGFSWGFVSDISLTENYFIKTGFEMDYMGGKLSYPYLLSVDGDNSEGQLTRKYDLRYITFPLTLKMRTNQFGKIAYYGEIGFSLSFNLSAKGKDSFEANSGNGNYTSEGDISDDITLMKGSLIIGGGVEYFIDSSTSLILGVSYNNGLSNILSGHNTIKTDIKQKGHLNYFQFTAGILF